MTEFSFEITAKDPNSQARTGIIHTRHGDIETPYLIPVATRAEVISLTPKDLSDLNIQCTLANTYHLHFLQGDKTIKNQGGLHSIMKFNKPIFTDSGGFQAFSLGWGKIDNICKIGFFPKERNEKYPSNNNGERCAIVTEQGVKFNSIYDGKESFIGPKESMQIQSNLGSDIIMAFDECTSPRATKEYTKQSLQRTHRWALESLKYKDPKQALYGIIQGGWFKDLRHESTQFILKQPFDGIAIGGSLGETKKDMHQILDWVIPELDGRPRHLLGIGWVDDIFECVERGIDTFDCVEMTRIARHRNLYISPKAGGNLENKFQIRLKHSKHVNDNSPIDPHCACTTCNTHTRSDLYKMYLQSTDKDNPEHKQYQQNFFKLATIHNLHFMQNLTQKIRQSIKQGTFRQLKQYWLKN